MTRIGRLSMAIAAAALAAPAALFFSAAIGRSLQPTSHEPSRTLDAIVTWFLSLGGGWLLGLLVVLPLVALVVAVLLLRRAWAADVILRSELTALGRAILPLANRPALLIAALVVLFGAVYFTALLIHGIAG